MTPSAAPSATRRGSAVAIRLAVAIGLTAYIVWKSHPAAVLAALAGADWRPMTAAVLLVLVDRALNFYRWLILLCIVDPATRPPVAQILRIFFVSTFVGTFLPASIGGEAVRAYSLARLDVRATDSVATVLMDRMLGLASTLVMALIGLALVRDLLTSPAIVASLALAAAACGATLLLVFNTRAAQVAARVAERLPQATRPAVEGMLISVTRYRSHHGELINVLLCSLGVQLLRIVQAYYLGRGLGVMAPLSAYLAFIPLILLVMLLPVTFNGIGTSQVAFVSFFARIGVPSAPAVALSVFFVALGIVGNLPGGLLYAFGRAARSGPRAADRVSPARETAADPSRNRLA